MQRVLLCALVCVLAAVSGLQGSGKKGTIAALKAEIKELRAQEKLDIKALDTRYKDLIDKVQNTELKIEELRTELRNEEKVALARIKNAKLKKEVKAQFDALIKGLSADLKSRRATAKLLREQKTSLEKHLKEAFTAQISELELEIKALESGSAGKSKK